MSWKEIDYIELDDSHFVVQGTPNHWYNIEDKFNYMNIFFWVIAIITSIVFWIQIEHGLFEMVNSYTTQPDMSNFTFKYSNYSWEWWNIIWIFTSMFLHWSRSHIIWNMLFLYIYALIVYSLLGFSGSMILYLVVWICAWIVSYFFNDIPSIWASWAIFWLFWFVTSYYYMNRDNLTVNLKDLTWVMILLAIYIIITGMMTPYIDNSAHIWWFLSWCLIWYVYYKDNKSKSF